MPRRGSGAGTGLQVTMTRIHLATLSSFPASREVHHPGPWRQASQVVLPTTVGPRRVGARWDDRPLKDPASRRKLREVLVREAKHLVVIAVAGLERVLGPLREPPGGQRRQSPKRGSWAYARPGVSSPNIASSTRRSLTRRARGQTSQLWPPEERNPCSHGLVHLAKNSGPRRELDERVPPDQA